MLGRTTKSRPTSNAEFQKAVRSYYGKTVKRRSDDEVHSRPSQLPVLSEDESERSWRERAEDQTVEQTTAELKARLVLGRQKLPPSRQNSIPIHESDYNPLVLPESKPKTPQVQFQFEDFLSQKPPISNAPRTSTPVGSSISVPIFVPNDTPISSAAPPLFPNHTSGPPENTLHFSPKHEQAKRSHSSVIVTQNAQTINPLNQTPPFEREETPAIKQETIAQPSTSVVSASRERRLPRSETPQSSALARWVESLLKTHDRYAADVNALRQEPQVESACKRVRMEVQQIVDVCTTDNPRDIKTISKAFNFFQSLFKTEIKNTRHNWKLFLMVCTCERYLKRVIGDESVLTSVAQLLAVLTKNHPDLFDVLVSMVFANCILSRLDTKQCLKKILDLSGGPPEDVPIWVAAENAQFKLLVGVCAAMPPESATGMRGLPLLWFLLKEAVQSTIIPLGTPFVLNAILSVTSNLLKRRYPTQLVEVIQRARMITDLDWPKVIQMSSDLVPDLEFSERARILLTSKNNATVQLLKVTLSSGSV